MSINTRVAAPIAGIGFRWYHAGFALAAGLGLGVLPPAGAETIAEWLGSALSWLFVAFLLVGGITAIVRRRDEWRPESILPGTPDSQAKYAVFGAICLQLFVLGTAWIAGAQYATILYMSLPFSLLIAVTVLADAVILERHGIEWVSLERHGYEWESPKFAYALAALLFGFVGGLVYWKRRGRTRSEWTDSDSDSATENPSPP